MADDHPAEIKSGDEVIRRSSLIRFKLAKLLIDFYPPVQTCEQTRELDDLLIRARDMFVPDAKKLLNELPDLEENETACDSDQPDTREAEEEEPRAEGETSAVGEYEASETVLETRPPPSPPNAGKRPRERSPAPAFRQWAVPMILSHEHIMATPPTELVGRIVRLWRPDLGLLSGHAYARVIAYEPELDLHLLAWLFDETLREEVCFRVKDPSATQLVVQHPTAAFMASLERHQCKKRRM
jgi:hypothetical protein